MKVGKKDDVDEKPLDKIPEKTDNTETDIFDYEKQTRRRVTRNPGSLDVGSTASSVAVNLEDSIHSVGTPKQHVPGTRSTSMEKQNLVPDANIIDPTYKKKADVQVQQSIINLWIQKSRVKNAQSVPASRIPSMTSRIPSRIKESTDSDSESYRSTRGSILGKPKSNRPSKTE